MTSDGFVADCEHVRDDEGCMWSVCEGDITFARAGMATRYQSLYR